ncbi:MAG: amidohydrolase family protein, partial [SAR202 cluster bacterium]|nr:amidohydrolase family protein [SAR202 cluster bacterium]
PLSPTTAQFYNELKSIYSQALSEAKYLRPRRRPRMEIDEILHLRVQNGGRATGDDMRIDIHSHIIPRHFWHAVSNGDDWFGATLDIEGDRRFINTRDRKAGPVEANWEVSLEQRVALMNSIGVDMQVLSTPPYFFNYHLPLDQSLGASKELNDEIADAIRAYPGRFSGLATVPFQDVPTAIAELERTMGAGLKGAELCTHVNGVNYDDPALLPFFEAAQDMGAFIFFHPHAPTAIERTRSYYLANTIGNPLETAITVASLIFGGVLDRLPDLKLCFAHGGGYACYGIGRLDRGFQVRDEAKVNDLSQAPSDYLRRLYFDCLTHSYSALDYLLENVSADNVLLGSDFPFDMGFDSPVEWVQRAPNVSQDDREKILGGNAARLLDLTGK